MTWEDMLVALGIGLVSGGVLTAIVLVLDRLLT